MKAVGTALSVSWHQETTGVGVDTTVLCLRVRGISCHHCKKKVERALRDVPGIREVIFNAETDQVLISGSRIDRDLVINTIEEEGYRVQT